jgi:hypothetical protein
MIYLAAGYGESATSPANGIKDLTLKLKCNYLEYEVKRYAWTDAEIVEEQMCVDNDKTIIGIGHSFGAGMLVSVAKSIAKRDAAKSIALFLVDPVPEGVLVGFVSRWVRKTMWIPDNVFFCRYYRREYGSWPKSKDVEGSGDVLGRVVPGTDHNSVMGSAWVHQSICDAIGLLLTR